MTTTIKIHIKTECQFCAGQAYLPQGEAESCTGELYIKHRKCVYCDESGLMSKWISLVELINHMDQINVMEPDYLALAEVEPTSQYQDGRDSAGI
jgi:hypothetical protein